MATKKCKHCQTEVDAKARVCPQCRGKLGTSTGCLAVVFASIIAAIFGPMVCTAMLPDIPESALTTAPPPPSPEEVALNEGKTEAQVLCPRAIKARLKSPATAKMPFISRHGGGESFVAVAAEDNSIIRAITYVDSQNSFGAMIRTKFQCDLKKIDGQWAIIKLETFD